ncbi:hypothetical protein COCSUDRAFT_34053 [Coccomyxa subellipsoidea C-169]|uniref:Uncharacterized protein n=1 Tax=Coccomyxa subellipsoidea (strain C-169) TaxID=574566 RepID=I0YP32_COCSC|nr:hypothetical protein COCSUDRAFT_34053 [Coccomyxa subellipsoidea C-169]EIE20151.1 hypothetical protein COCSUDRAFT_34053 [Coccomyxa subellipsoidea C-169]|eukprot:XP_005644695.1 hypothetical protein COCSUDRAFT_34053 [Coccomyxa subellipsoidea C-169]
MQLQPICLQMPALMSSLANSTLNTDWTPVGKALTLTDSQGWHMPTPRLTTPHCTDRITTHN